MVRNFEYLEQDRFAVSAAPQTAEEVDWLQAQGVRAVVSMHPVPAAVQSRMAERGIAWRPFPVADFAAGIPEGLREVLEFIGCHAARQRPVLIHCQGGGGRSRSLYAAYLLRQGVPLAEALERIPGVEKDAQKAFLHGFAAGLGCAGPTGPEVPDVPPGA